MSQPPSTTLVGRKHASGSGAAAPGCSSPDAAAIGPDDAVSKPVSPTIKQGQLPAAEAPSADMELPDSPTILQPHAVTSTARDQLGGSRPKHGNVFDGGPKAAWQSSKETNDPQAAGIRKVPPSLLVGLPAHAQAPFPHAVAGSSHIAGNSQAHACTSAADGTLQSQPTAASSVLLVSKIPQASCRGRSSVRSAGRLLSVRPVSASRVPRPAHLRSRASSCDVRCPERSESLIPRRSLSARGRASTRCRAPPSRPASASSIPALRRPEPQHPPFGQRSASLIPRSTSSRRSSTLGGSARDAALCGNSPTQVPLPRSGSPLSRQHNARSAPASSAGSMVRMRTVPERTASAHRAGTGANVHHQPSLTTSTSRSASGMPGCSAHMHISSPVHSSPSLTSPGPLRLRSVRPAQQPMKHWLPPLPSTQPTGATQPRDAWPAVQPLPPPPVPLHATSSGLRMNMLARPVHSALVDAHPELGFCEGSYARAMAGLEAEHS